MMRETFGKWGKNLRELKQCLPSSLELLQSPFVFFQIPSEISLQLLSAPPTAIQDIELQ